MNECEQREFLHSLGRIADRIIQVDRDVKRIVSDIKELDEDCGKIRLAVETFIADYTKTKAV